jgi:hypothetical protein
MSEKRTIQFNPDFLNFSNNNKTRKKRQPTDNNNTIKVKNENKPKKTDTLKKRSILRMIRQHQEDKYKKMFDENEVKKENKRSESEHGFLSDFEESKKYMNKLSDETVAKNNFNSTLKNYPSRPNSLLYNIPLENVITGNVLTSNPIQDVTQNVTPISLQNTMKLEQPKYGCLKNGNLPTYKNWMNTTQKVYSGGNNAVTPRPAVLNNEPIKTKESFFRPMEMKKTMEKLQSIKNTIAPRKMKQKKTIRRTYKIGKSKVIPRVSVLVSNRTIRNNISTKSQLLKQVPIQEIKKYLIDRGFIKVGSSAPNDVLRKMYESAVLICGEVQNHNPDNLLYNFLNDK